MELNILHMFEIEFFFVRKNIFFSCFYLLNFTTFTRFIEITLMYKAKIFRAIYTSISCALLLPTVSWALSVDDVKQGIIQARDINQKAQVLQNILFDKERQSKGAAIRLEMPINSSKHRQKITDSCHFITEIEIENNFLIAKNIINQIVIPYQNKCLAVAGIQNLLGDLTNSFIRAGFITTRVYLPGQNLSSGKLLISIQEGRIAAITGPANKSILVRGAFPTAEDEVLYLRDIEQGLEQLNRLASNNSSMSLVPGDKPGETQVVIENNPTKRWSLSASVDNYGSASTGKEQGALTASIDNPLLINDYFSVTYKKRAKINHSNKPWKDNDSINFNYIVPYGYHTFSIGTSDSEYQSTLNTSSNELLKLSGAANSAYAQVSRMLKRTQRDKIKVTLKVTAKESKTYMADQLLAVSSRKLAIADLNFNWNRQLAQGNLNVDLGFSFGTKLFNSLEDPQNLPKGFPKAQFKKVNLSINHSRLFPLFGRTVQLSTALQGQYTNDVLFGSEQITIGGFNSVRGFESLNISGDKGFYLRNDLSFSTAIENTSTVIKPYLGVDFGRIEGNSEHALKGSLMGGAVGVKFTNKIFQAELAHAFPLYKPKFLGRETSKTTYLRLSINF